MNSDLDESQLLEYRSEVTEPTDFDDFWHDTLEQSASVAWAPEFTLTNTPIETLDTYDVKFSGWGGHPIRAWLRLPKIRSSSIRAVVEFVGYGGGRGSVLENLTWASAGFAHMIVDTRGQGSSWGSGDTADPVGSSSSVPGFLTRGLESPETYYYRRVFTDAVHAVRTARAMPFSSVTDVSVIGTSQGGGIALAAAALSDDVAFLHARVPFLCDFPRALQLASREPYAELIRWLGNRRDKQEAALATLRYFDGVNFARRSHARALFSAGLMDPICPPSTVYGAFHAYAGPKAMDLWVYNDHSGGGIFDDMNALTAIG